MTHGNDLPGDSFHNFEIECPNPEVHGNPFRYCACGWIEPQEVKPKLHAYVQMKDLNDGVKFASRLCLDRVRREGYNPRKGTLTITFDDDGVGARWEPTS